MLKFYKIELRLQFHCYILICRKCPCKTLYQHTIWGGGKREGWAIVHRTPTLPPPLLTVRTGSPSNSDRNWHRKNAILPTHRTSHHLHLLSITVICHDLFVISVSPWKIVSYSWHFFQVILRDQPIMLLTTLFMI